MNCWDSIWNWRIWFHIILNLENRFEFKDLQLFSKLRGQNGKLQTESVVTVKKIVNTVYCGLLLATGQLAKFLFS